MGKLIHCSNREIKVTLVFAIHKNSGKALFLTAHTEHTKLTNSLISLNCRSHPSWAHRRALDPDSYAISRTLAAQLRTAGSDGLVYPSARQNTGQCVGIFYPDLAANAVQGRHPDYHWDGAWVDHCNNPSNGHVFRIVPNPAV